MFSDLLGVKFDAKTGDVLGSLKVFVLGVGCLGWVVWEGKIKTICIGFVSDFYWSMLTLKNNTHRLCHGFLWANVDAKKYHASALSRIFMGQC